jgi:hypothetical protein
MRSLHRGCDKLNRRNPEWRHNCSLTAGEQGTPQLPSALIVVAPPPASSAITISPSYCDLLLSLSYTEAQSLDLHRLLLLLLLPWPSRRPPPKWRQGEQSSALWLARQATAALQFWLKVGGGRRRVGELSGVWQRVFT